MNTITNGLQRFQKRVFPRMRKHFGQLALGQTPRTLFITCSDSRVDPSLITQAQPGELFVLRNAGNLVPPFGHDASVDATIEYAMLGLEVSQILVCGHSGCGAIGAALDPVRPLDMPAMQAWLKLATPCVEATAHLPEHQRYHDAIAMNVLFQLERLRTHPSVAAAIEGRGLALYGWVYDIGTGAIMEIDYPTA